MAPSSPNNHMLKEAGRHSDELNNQKPRGKRYFEVMDSIKAHKTVLPDDLSASQLTTPRTTRSVLEFGGGGLTSAEYRSASETRGRKHIHHGGCLGKRTPSEPSLASEAISEDSADLHLGHRQKVVKCWSQKHEQVQEVAEQDEPVGGVSSHHLARRRGKLGYGKRHFGVEHEWTHHHRSNRIDHPGGDDAFFHDGKFTSFLGPARRHHGKTFESDHAFDDKLDETEKSWIRSRKHFEEKTVPVHATEKIPIGVSTQVDLHTSGFLGTSRHNYGGILHKGTDPISHQIEDFDDNSLDAYGLGHRGRRKFLVQNNLASGCRHNEAIHVGSPTKGKSASTPDLKHYDPQSDAPFYQDDLTPEKQSQKPLVIEHPNGKPRNAKRDIDQTWSALVWAGRGVDNETAHKFIEGEDLAKKPVHAFQQEDFKNTLGHSKRNFGNVHNKSDFRLDFADDHTWKSDHLHEIPLGETDRHDDLELKTHPLNYVRWGHGHGRRKFKVNDHLDRDDDGVECYVSANGTVLGKMKHKKVTDHLDADGPPDVACFFLDPDGKAISYKPRHHVVQKDHINELLDNDVKSDTSSALGVAGQKRKNELIRPKSARRFPDKENFRRDKSTTPRAASQPKLSSSGKARWQV